MEKFKRSKGITLIALVITIIVLLILAGITISLTIGQDGILKRTQEAGENYTNAAEYEREQLAELDKEVDNIINRLGGNNKNYTMIEGVPVPNGFTHTEGTLETGFVIKDITTNEDGTPSVTNGNEFVWIPVDDTTPYSYDRYALLSTQPEGETDTATNSIKIKHDSSGSNYYTEAMPTIGTNRTELDSINEYKGFYIGRYEVGVIGYDETVSTSNSSNSTNWTGYSNGTAVVQKGKQVWNYITRDKAKEIAEGMYTDLESVTSRLCSSYAWDTALKFIETNYPEYPTDSVGGNYDTSSGGTGQLQNTGYDTTHPCNIYDMGGNVWEWTTEAFDVTSVLCTIRGGGYYISASNCPAACRNPASTTSANDSAGFRSTLYL